MRRVYLDIATTGMGNDDRVIEVALIEEVGEKLTDNGFNRLINPASMLMTESAIDVTGYSNDFLKQFAQFYDVADILLAFIKDAELVCWDDNYALSYLNRELSHLGKPEILKNNYSIATDIRTTIKNEYSHLSTLRHFLYQHFEINVDNTSKSWAQTNCLGMAFLYQKIILSKPKFYPT